MSLSLCLPLHCARLPVHRCCARATSLRELLCVPLQGKADYDPISAALDGPPRSSLPPSLLPCRASVKLAAPLLSCPVPASVAAANRR